MWVDGGFIIVLIMDCLEPLKIHILWNVLIWRHHNYKATYFLSYCQIRYKHYSQSKTRCNSPWAGGVSWASKTCGRRSRINAQFGSINRIEWFGYRWFPTLCKNMNHCSYIKYLKGCYNCTILYIYINFTVPFLSIYIGVCYIL